MKFGWHPHCGKLRIKSAKKSISLASHKSVAPKNPSATSQRYVTVQTDSTQQRRCFFLDVKCQRQPPNELFKLRNALGRLVGVFIRRGRDATFSTTCCFHFES